MDGGWDFSNEEEGGIKEEELRWLVMQKSDSSTYPIPDPTPTSNLNQVARHAAYEAGRGGGCRA